jgi:hypothetical protein
MDGEGCRKGKPLRHPNASERKSEADPRPTIVPVGISAVVGISAIGVRPIIGVWPVIAIVRPVVRISPVVGPIPVNAVLAANIDDARIGVAELTAVEDGSADAGVANAIPANPAKRAAANVRLMVNLLTLVIHC